MPARSGFRFEVHAPHPAFETSSQETGAVAELLVAGAKPHQVNSKLLWFSTPLRGLVAMDSFGPLERNPNARQNNQHSFGCFLRRRRFEQAP